MEINRHFLHMKMISVKNNDILNNSRSYRVCQIVAVYHSSGARDSSETNITEDKTKNCCLFV